MLSKEANQLLCRVGPGTPAGNLMRRYWIPAVYPPDIPTPDSPPIRVRLLGEDLIAFRATDGSVGLIQNACPHRGASLFFGRNEEQGLRCVYHGWKFDVDGRCVDMPSEPAESNFRTKVRAAAYPTIERGGVVWAYMGPATEHLPDLPGFMSNLLPESHSHIIVRVQDSNYLQALEGGYDSAHVAFLHSRLTGPARTAPTGGLEVSTMRDDKSPKLAAIDTDFGVMIGARRDGVPGKAYWRANLFLFPFYHMSPGGAEGLARWSAWVPIDDETTLRWVCAWHNERPVTEEDLAPYRVLGGSWYLLPPEDYETPTSLPAGRWRTRRNAANDYMIDREMQRTVNYTGVTDFLGQDQVVTESMGTVNDRTREHLGTTDIGIIAVRRRLARAVEALAQDGELPPGVANPEAFRVRSGGAVLPSDVDWVVGLKDAVYLKEPQLSDASETAVATSIPLDR